MPSSDAEDVTAAKPQEQYARSAEETAARATGAVKRLYFVRIVIHNSLNYSFECSLCFPVDK